MVKRHDLEWVTAPPLWERAQADAGARTRFREPALLRFHSDAFMDELIAAMGRGDDGVAGRVARPETWEQPAAGWVPAGDASLARTLRLYQPAHGRFYVTAASLVCRRVGLPVHRVKAAAGERASMLIRRLVPRPGRSLDLSDPDSFSEQAWVGDRKAGVWKRVAGTVVEGEERLPLFPLVAAGEGGRTRQVWAGMLPVASREIYEAARPADAASRPLEPGAAPDPLQPLSDPRRAAFVGRVIQGMTALRETPPATATAATLAAAAPDMRESLSLVLLDLVDFLDAELRSVWCAVRDESATGLGAAESAVYARLGAVFGGTVTWRGALRAADAHRPALLGTGTTATPPPVPAGFDAAEIRAAVVNLIHGGHFQAEVFAALGDPPATPPAAPGGAPVLAARAAEAGEAEGGVYWLRFLYERPVCEPYHDPLLSAPSRPFRLAPFFDPDAPARPLLIRMPLDTSPKGLRKFPRGVAMLMSSKLRQQTERVRNQKLSDLDEGKVGDEPSWGIGMICSLSIPIITLCAFIVLMIFLQLLNIVFWWMALFRICLPIPVRND